MSNTTHATLETVYSGDPGSFDFTQIDTLDPQYEMNTGALLKEARLYYTNKSGEKQAVVFKRGAVDTLVDVGIGGMADPNHTESELIEDMTEFLLAAEHSEPLTDSDMQEYYTNGRSAYLELKQKQDEIGKNQTQILTGGAVGTGVLSTIGAALSRWMRPAKEVTPVLKFNPEFVRGSTLANTTSTADDAELAARSLNRAKAVAYESSALSRGGLIGLGIGALLTGAAFAYYSCNQIPSASEKLKNEGALFFADIASYESFKTMIDGLPDDQKSEVKDKIQTETWDRKHLITE